MRSPRYAPHGEWVDRDLDDPGDVAPTAGSVLSLARAFGAEPGAPGIGVLATLPLAPLDDAGLLEVLSLWEMQAAWLAAAQNEALCALRDRAARRAACAGPEPGGRDKDGDVDDREWDREELSLAQGIGGFEASRRLATAIALRSRLTATAEALAAGRISWRHADVLARATHGLADEVAAAVERRVLADRRAITVAQWRRRAAAWVATLCPAAAENAAESAYEQRSLRAWPAGDGTGQLAGTFTTESFATVLAAVDTKSACTGPDDYRCADQRRADALVEICAEHLANLAGHAGGSGAVPPYLVVHLTDESGTGAAMSRDHANGPTARPLGMVRGEPLAPSAMCRLSCDAAVQWVRSDTSTGSVTDLGRTRRFPDAKLRAAVSHRDHATCTFPGCGNTRALHAHHLEHWAEGGATDQANLTLVCGRHHRAVHEGGWRPSRQPDGRLSWVRPSGQQHTAPVAGWRAPPELPWYDPPLARPPAKALSDQRSATTKPHPSVWDLGPPPF